MMMATQLNNNED